jgi:hypothetical protein
MRIIRLGDDCGSDDGEEEEEYASEMEEEAVAEVSV